MNTWEARRGLAGNLTSEISSPTIKSKLVTMSITWNVEGFSPKSEEPIRGLFSHVLENRPHLIFISLQEVFECKPHNWTKIMNNSISSQECQTWKNVLSKVLGAIDPTFKLLAAECLGALMLLVFSKVPQELFTEQVKFTKNSLGYMGGMMANKAALTCAFRVRDCRIHVMGCHLASGESESSNSNRVSQLFQVLPGVVEGTYEAGNKVRCSLNRRESSDRESTWLQDCSAVSPGPRPNL